VTRLTLHRPDRLNAMTAEMFGELAEETERLRLDNGVRAVVLTGAGSGFCAGYDLDAAAGFPEAGTAELLYTGRPVFAEEAVRIGLANRVVEDAALATEAVELAAQIAEHAPLAVQLTKRSLRANVDAPALLGALELESRAQVALLGEPATTEAVARLRHTRRQRPTAD